MGWCARPPRAFPLFIEIKADDGGVWGEVGGFLVSARVANCTEPASPSRLIDSGNKLASRPKKSDFSHFEPEINTFNLFY